MHLPTISRVRIAAIAAALCVLLGGSLAQAQVGETTLLFGGETLEGVTLNDGAAWPETKLELNTDERFVSEGDSSIHISSVSPENATGNSYLSFTMALDEPVDLTGMALQFDAWTDLPETTRALYLRAYNDAGECVLSFLNWAGPLSEEMTTITLMRGFGDVLAWEQSMVTGEDLSAITSLRIWIGTGQAGVPFGAYIDNIRFGESTMRSFSDVTEPKLLVLRTPLVENGEAARIVAPEDAAWAPVAQAVQTLIADLTGARPEILSAEAITDERMREETTIVIGNVANNPRMLYFYSHGYIFPDDYYPGEGGYEVRTVHDPWGTGFNALSIGASDPAGALAGIEALRGACQAGASLVLEPTLLVKLSPDAERRWGRTFTQEPDDAWFEQLQQRAEADLEAGAHTGLFGTMSSAGRNYQMTGKDGWARGFVWLAKRAKAHRDTNPPTFGGPWGMDSDFQAYTVLPAWDVVEESPAVSDEDRLEVSRVLFQWMTEAVASSSAPSFGNTHPRHNHNTFPSLGCLFAGEYFEKYYDAGEGTRWLQIADDTFQNQSKLFKPHEDCNGYQWLTLYHTILYCLARPDFTFFDNGNARRVADYAIMSMDNLSYSVTYGDTGAYEGWWSEMPYLHAAEWYYRDGRYSWATDRKREVSGRLSPGWFAAKTAAVEPADLIGSLAFPVEPLYFDAFRGQQEIELAQTVDKVVFRNGFGADDQYLLLDGLNNGGHQHYDGNSISRMTQNGRIWLADASYMDSLPKFHSTALVLRDGQSAPLPGFAEMEHMRDLPSVGFSETTLRDYAGVDWHRNIFWLKGDWFLVADEMEAREAGDYSFRILWQTIGNVDLQEDGLAVEQQGQHFAIRMTPELRYTLENDAAYGANWSGYKFIDEPVVRKLTGIWNGTLAEGEQVTLFTLLHASGEAGSPLHLTRIGPNQVAVTGEGAEPTVIGVGGPENEIALAGARITGHAAVARAGLMALFDAQSVDYQAQFLDFPGGQDIEMALGEGNIVTYNQAGRTVQPPMERTEELSYELSAFSDQMVRMIIEGAIATAPPAQPQPLPGGDAPELTTLWSYSETLDNYVLTGNRGVFGAVNTGVQLAAEPEPLASNIFAADGAPGNTVDNILDGAEEGVNDAVMWADDQPVTVNLAFDRAYEIDSVLVKAWFATSSSKNKLFQLGNIRIEASDDGFAADTRVLEDFTDTETHGNWGLPGHAPQRYEFTELDASARNLRLMLTPRPGTAVYLAEIEVRGTGEGIEQLALASDSTVPAHSFISMHAADLDGDGTDEVIAGSTNGSVYVFESDGSLLWSREIGGRVRAVSTARFAGQQHPAVLAGGTSATLYAFDSEGDELWTFAMPRYKSAGVITTLFPADLDADGADEVVAGTESWRYYAFGADGAEIWRVESVRMSTVGAAADLDGDGADEVVAGTEYHSWPVYDSDGRLMFSYSPRTGPGCNDVAIADITGDGAPEIVFAGLDSFVHAIDNRGQLLWKFGTGDSVSAVAPLTVGNARMAAGSRSFNLYGFAGDGSVVWRRDLGSPVVDVASFMTADGERVVATTDSGAVVVADASDGAILGRAQLMRGGLVVVAADLDGDGAQEAVVSSADGKITALR